MQDVQCPVPTFLYTKYIKITATPLSATLARVAELLRVQQYERDEIIAAQNNDHHCAIMKLLPVLVLLRLLRGRPRHHQSSLQ